MKTLSITKYFMASPKPNSNNDLQITQNPSGMRSIKRTLNFQMNYETTSIKNNTTTLQISYGKYFKNTRCITLTQKGAPCV